MTGSEQRLAALAAVFAGSRAPALLSRVSGPRAVAGVENAGRLAGASRRERLASLSAAVSVEPGFLRASAEAAAALERPRVAAVLRALGAGCAPPCASPPLVRLCRERIGR